MHFWKEPLNTMIKIDDTDFKASNPGIWSHNMNDLMQTEKFTTWSAYSQDEIIDEVSK